MSKYVYLRHILLFRERKLKYTSIHIYIQIYIFLWITQHKCIFTKLDSRPEYMHTHVIAHTLSTSRTINIDQQFEIFYMSHRLKIYIRNVLYIYVCISYYLISKIITHLTKRKQSLKHVSRRQDFKIEFIISISS